MTLETILDDQRWNAPGLAAIATRAVDATLTHFSLSPDEWDIGLLGCSDARIATLNAQFRSKENATNVLSWPSIERSSGTPGAVPDTPANGDDEELGDIAIAYETCALEAKAANKPFESHICHLIVHATLHLLGYDHIDDKDAALMESIETKVLASMGYPDPYE